MAARAYWKGYLKLTLVSCPIALFPATSEREKISFHQLKETGKPDQVSQSMPSLRMASRMTANACWPTSPLRSAARQRKAG